MREANPSEVPRVARAQLGAITRSLLRRPLAALSDRLQRDEEVVVLAVGGTRTAGIWDYIPGTVVFFAILVLGVFLFGRFELVFVLAFAISFAVDFVVRRR